MEAQDALNRTTQFLWPAVILCLLVALPACKQTQKGGNSRPPVARCMEDLDNIPELAALKARDKERPEDAQGKPLEGLEIALTINDQVRSSGDPDDLDNWCEHEDSRENFDRLVAALKQHQMPPTVDFAIGQNLDPQLAQAWVAGGNLLGSMTYSRKKPNKTGVDEFVNDLARNDQTLAAYWKPDAKSPKYFRFPKFKVSMAPQDQARIEKYLSDNGYTVVPATVDAHDEKFSWIYCAATARGDAACSNLVKAYFRSLLLDTTLKARESARQIAGREVKHVLVFRANQFTCDNLAELLAWYKSLGARFIPLADALADPFYKMVDEEGMSAGLKVFRKVKTSQAQQDPKP